MHTIESGAAYAAVLFWVITAIFLLGYVLVGQMHRFAAAAAILGGTFTALFALLIPLGYAVS